MYIIWKNRQTLTKDDDYASFILFDEFQKYIIKKNPSRSEKILKESILYISFPISMEIDIR